MESEPAIDLEHVSKRFGATRSLEGLSLRVRSGAVFGFLGPNGAGKTTTLRVLLGLVTPDRGSIRVLGLDPRSDGAEVRARVGALLESDGLYDRLSAWHNLDYHARIRRLDGKARAARIEELLRSFGLWERRRELVVSWSKGMRQKLAIARALLHRPRLLMLDEPFSGLDPTAAAELRARIVRLGRDEQVTVFLTTHDLAHVEKACSDVAVIRGGRVIATGTPAQLTGDDGPVRMELRAPGLTRELLQSLVDAGLIQSFAEPGEVVQLVCARERKSALAAELFARGVRLEELHSVRSSLEDAFLSLFADEAADAAR